VGGAHGIIVETMSDVQEAAVAVEAANDAGAPVVIACMTFSPLPNGRLRTMMGVSPEDAARQLHAAGAGIVGINCGTHMGFDACAAAIALMRRVVDVPLVAMPNAGSPTWDDGRASYALSPAEFAEGLRPVVEAGAALIGGCCGTTPAHIAALREMIGA
jgi:5-methyltetrahydrofolate--homocysteine methyltransferase